MQKSSTVVRLGIDFLVTRLGLWLLIGLMFISFVLVRTSPNAAAALQASSSTAEYDYQMVNVKILGFKSEGQATALLLAPLLRHQSSTDLILVQEPSVVRLGAQRTLWATAQGAQYQDWAQKFTLEQNVKAHVFEDAPTRRITLEAQKLLLDGQLQIAQAMQLQMHIDHSPAR